MKIKLSEALLIKDLRTDLVKQEKYVLLRLFN